MKDNKENIHSGVKMSQMTTQAHVQFKKSAHLLLAAKCMFIFLS